MAMGSSPTPPEIRSPEQDWAAEDAAAAAQGEEEQFDDAFDIPHKNASHDSLLRWRRFIFDACKDLTLIILMVAAAISLTLGMATEVLRGGKRFRASIFDIVVGDVIPLNIGDQVPADGILISGHSLAIDESSMTGESKTVTGVGINTEWGQLMANLSEDNGEETPLQVRLNGVATFIGMVGLSVAGVVLGVLVIRLAYSMRKMMRDKALVRRLSSCETMGSATTICSDKTGTLTLNKMTVVEAHFIGIKLDPCDDVRAISRSAAALLIEGIAQNTTGTVFLPEDGGAADVTGSPTEKAILSWGLKIGMDFTDVRSKSSVLHVFPFNSEKKRGGVAVQSATGVNVHWKGAAELVLSSCKSWLSLDGSVQPMGVQKHNEYKKSIEDMAKSSLRCVAFAYCQCEIEMIPKEDIADWKLPEEDLTLLGIVGIKVRMVTGDNIDTAKAIALECGILDANGVTSEPFVIEGKVFREMSETARGEIVDKITVMGRSSPNDKLLLVQALKRKGHVVAVTGDGTNDAPALHEADIGLSMGISGTEVAKESSDIIILDDDFTSVVKVVRWGRSVYANIQKFIQFQLTVNVAALVINVIAAVSSGDVPLNAVELLWVNLIMDTLGALALATEPPTDNLMKRQPVGRREPLVTNIMWRNLFVQAIYQIAILLIFNFSGTKILRLENESPDRAEKMNNTFIFNTFVFCQYSDIGLSSEINCPVI
ncbi:hypothetical protein ACQ4PT_017279 [Festuca glaucescens]